MGIPRPSRGYASIWVIVYQLPKSTHFFPIQSTFGAELLPRLVWGEWGARIYYDQFERTVQVLENMLRLSKIPWQISEDINHIYKLLTSMTVIVKHTFREAKQLVDAIANLALQDGVEKQFYAIQDLLSACKTILNLDKCQVLILESRQGKSSAQKKDVHKS